MSVGKEVDRLNGKKIHAMQDIIYTLSNTLQIITHIDPEPAEVH